MNVGTSAVWPLAVDASRVPDAHGATVSSTPQLRCTRFCVFHDLSAFAASATLDTTRKTLSMQSCRLTGRISRLYGSSSTGISSRHPLNS